MDWHVVRNHFLTGAKIAVSHEVFDDSFRKIYQEAIQKGVEERSGARTFLNKLRRSRRKIALVSSAAHWMIEGVVKRNGFGEYFDLVVGREDVRQHKPHPEAYVLALSRLNISAKDAVVFEDSEAGVVAGCAAGCRVVAIRHEYNRRHDFSEAMRVIESYDEFVFTEQT